MAVPRMKRRRDDDGVAGPSHELSRKKDGGLGNRVHDTVIEEVKAEKRKREW